jgi:hypothetical protein
VSSHAPAFVFNHVQIWPDGPQERTYSIPQNGYISKGKKWQGRHNVNNPPSYLQTVQTLKVVPLAILEVHDANQPFSGHELT